MNRQRTWTAVLAAVLALGAAGGAWANNLQITNLTVSGRDNSTAYVQFDIKWENSWRYQTVNHDAAWVFFKVLKDSETDWHHVTLEGTGTTPMDGYSVGAGTPIEMIVPVDRVGLFVRRSGEGAGTTAVQNVKAVWNFASNGLVKTENVKIQAFGLEMVYVAEGSFKVGSGGAGGGELYEGGGGTNPFQITNAGPIMCGNAAGQLWGASQSGTDSMGGSGTISSNFPNGYAAFYCMKYEVTEGQWVDFFNTLTDAQKTARDITGATGKGTDGVDRRNTVSWPNTTVDATSAARDRACSYLSFPDLMAFADWAGLRPMTELEFEKACRGPLPPVANEYAWGSATIMAPSSLGISGPENGTETITSDTSLGGCNYGPEKTHTGGDGGVGPLRAGIFATTGASRVPAGASYWGIMELSGNVWERPVTIGNAEGRAFTGLHGDGQLKTTGTPGDADVSNWPAAASAYGSGYRGSSWYNAATLARASDRLYAAYADTVRSYHLGARAGRSAPSGVAP